VIQACPALLTTLEVEVGVEEDKVACSHGSVLSRKGFSQSCTCTSAKLEHGSEHER
jgi:hypothetical protein